MNNNIQRRTRVFRFLVVLYLILSSIEGLSAQAKSELRISLNLKNAGLKEFLTAVRTQTNLNFVYNATDAQELKPITIRVVNAEVSAVLEQVFRNTGLGYRIDGEIITLFSTKRVKTNQKQEESNKKKLVRGVVYDPQRHTLPGATIWLKGTKKGAIADINGRYTIDMTDETATTLQFSSVGMQSREVNYNGQSTLDIVMVENKVELKEASVVATGMFTRDVKNYTGAISTFNAEELKRVGNQNLLFSLKNLDPSFVINENINFGSDPNQLPDIQLRGPSSISDIKGQYQTALNQPLFILNGFETTLEKVYDLDMNLVKSVTILKDATAKAIYGSKAANGVIVIETTLPQQGKLRVSYTASVDVSIPDLRSYNLTNAAEKLQAELLAGKYSSSNAYTQASLTANYNALYQEVLKGVNTYWMSQPLRTGIGQKHSLMFDGGDEAMRYSANVSYNNIAGVMKGSTRNTLSGNLILLYRHKGFSFTNNLSIDNNHAVNSPYGNFGDYSAMNPYLRIYNTDGALIKSYGNGIYNPLYDAQLNSKNETGYTTITENFYGEWRLSDALKLTGRAGIIHQNSSSDIFIPASSTQYAGISSSSDEYLLRGQYTKENGNTKKFNADAGIAYSLQKGKHVVFSNLLYSIEQGTTETSSMIAVGFPSDKLDYISLARAYQTGGTPGGDESTTRSLGVVLSTNYSYDNRYLSDFSYRLSGSSQFGSNNRWGGFWSLGLGWNVHKEKFMQSARFIDLLKFRGSLGYTGSQNFSSYQAISTYNYLTDKTYNGDMGVSLQGLANDNLKWQQQYDQNIGADISLWNKLSVKVNLYHATTTNLLTDINLAPSSGFSTYKENLGETLNKGFELGVNWRAWYNAEKKVSLSLFANVAHNSNRISKISNALKKLNEENDANKTSTSTSSEAILAKQTPSTRYEEGQSLSAIWGVRSNGIDPVTGKEVFIKKDGTTTYTWSTDDQVVLGDATPRYRGNLGCNFSIIGFEINLSFSYKCGGQVYNSTLVSKVENVDIYNNNVDKRVLTDRWNTPGVPAKFKSITDQSITKPTSRFVENLNEFNFSAINLSYDFSRLNFIKKTGLQFCRLTFNMNDIAWISSVKREQGLAYPKAEIVSTALQVRF